MINIISNNKSVLFNNQKISINPTFKKGFMNNNSSYSSGKMLYYPLISFGRINENNKYKDLNLDIPNLHSINGNGLRGESLAGKKNKNGEYPAGTVNYLVNEKLKKYSKVAENKE